MTDYLSPSYSVDPSILGRRAVRGVPPKAQHPVQVAVVSHVWPHYRLPVMAAMDRSRRIKWTFYGSGEVYEGIVHADTSKVRCFVKVPFHRRGHALWQTAAVSAACANKYDAVIFLADPHFTSNWIAAPLARLLGKSVLFWGHGWRRYERGARRYFRNGFYHLANRILVYAERGRQLGCASGFPSDRITVVYNSLDVPRANEIFNHIETGKLDTIRPHSLFVNPDRPLLICTARITEACRFDLLIEAARQLNQDGRPVNLLLVGEGPQSPSLATQAIACEVDIKFFGDCYDEEILGQLIYHADLTVSPGKIGLSAMHSLMYGTPAISHRNLDDQMPEVEAIEEGITGMLFNQGDAGDLAAAITSWLASKPDRNDVRRAARQVIAERWNPARQAAIIEHAVLQELSEAF